MHAELDELLTRERFLSCDRGTLLTTLKRWIALKNPACLIHPHGFFVMLLKRCEGEEWRLHLWLSDRGDDYGMPGRVHTHDKHVDSRILLGTLTNLQYSVSEADPGEFPLYEAHYQGDRYLKQTTNTLRKASTRVDLSMSGSSLMLAGESYRVERHTFHEAVPSAGLTTCTLVCMHSPAPGAIKVVGVDGYPDVLSFERSEHPSHLFLRHL
ncbi:hypothetical protein CYD26_21395 [Pseudomonas sp. FFUP_PS_473]|nr:hypothetical protein CYD26_21395 [Pseudomonas sp. FFUP_PS_473]